MPDTIKQLLSDRRYNFIGGAGNLLEYKNGGRVIVVFQSERMAEVYDSYKNRKYVVPLDVKLLTAIIDYMEGR